MAQANQQQGDYRNNKYEFGFLNTAQDRNDLKDNDLTVLNAVDLDALALGTVISSDYADAGGTGPDYSVANLTTNQFRVNGVTDSIEVHIDSIWTPIDTLLTPPSSPTLAIVDSNGGVKLASTSTNWANYPESISVENVVGAGISFVSGLVDGFTCKLRKLFFR